LIATDAETAVGKLAPTLGGNAGKRGNAHRVQHDKVVAGTVHLYERHRHRALGG
jgi:hypothetical protein